MKNDIISDLLRGHTDTIVLKILASGDNYGYQIHKTIIALTNHQFEIKEATLYSSYKRLEKSGAITSYWGEQNLGGRRKYYKLTPLGVALLAQNIEDLKVTQMILNNLLEVNI